jgi:hypothetical protein
MQERESLLIAQILADPVDSERFRHDPAAVLRERGIDIPAGIRLMLVEDPENARHYLVPYPVELEVAEPVATRR